MIFSQKLRVFLLAGLISATALLPARAAEVWIGGSRAWPDFIAPATTDQWRFLQSNADGFYINNFALRLTDKTLKLAPTLEGREAQLRAMNDLMKSDKLFYETDVIHATDEFDRATLDAFARAGFEVTAATINRGTTIERTAILTGDGKIPLYYMFGPWRGGGDINNAQNVDLRASLESAAGGAVDGPVTMWRKNAGQMKPMVYSTIRWNQARGQKFLYLLAPNESGADFLEETRKLAHDLEDNDANPDIWAVSFYGPPTFRDKLETLPESLPDGQAAPTFSGAAYWLIHHLRDPQRAAQLQAPADTKGKLTLGARARNRFAVTLSNGSSWLDLAPVVRARGIAPQGWTMRWMLGTRDVTAQVCGDGLIFNREMRLAPGDKRELTLQIERTGASTNRTAFDIELELLPHPSETVVSQRLPLQIVG